MYQLVPDYPVIQVRHSSTSIITVQVIIICIGPSHERVPASQRGGQNLRTYQQQQPKANNQVNTYIDN